MAKYLKHDEEVRVLKTREELMDYLQFRSENDEWVECFINELAAVGIPDEPLFIPSLCTDVKIVRHGFTTQIGDIDYNDVNNEECIKDTGLFLVFPWKDKLRAFPTRRIAYATICKRAEDDCGTMYRFDMKPNKGVLPIKEKAERLCRDFTLYSNNCKILLRDEKVSAVLSKEYAILPADELIDALESQLATDHPDFLFDSGTVSHEFLIAEYLLNDREMEESFRLKLNDAGADIGELRAGVRFSTSDVGLSRVYATLFYDADGVRTTLAGRVELEHKGQASIEHFRDDIAKLGMLFRECEDRIEELGNLDIKDVSGTVKRVRTENSFLPKQISEQVEDDLKVRFPAGGTGIDVYLALNEIVQRHAASTSLSPTRYLNLCEQASKLMYLDFQKYDAQ